MQNETVMTIVSVLVALLATVTLFYGNFLLAWLVDLISGRGIPVGRFLGTAAVAGVSAAGLYATIRFVIRFMVPLRS